MQKVGEKLKTLERKSFGKNSPIRVAVVGCGYSGVELAATVSERLQDKGVVQAINVGNTILPNAPSGNREVAQKVRNLLHEFWDMLVETVPFCKFSDVVDTHFMQHIKYVFIFFLNIVFIWN